MNTYENIIQEQRAFFASGATRDIEFRKKSLKTLKEVLENKEKDITEALKADLGKPAFETYAAELGGLYAEINHVLRNLKCWSRPKRVRTPMSLFPGASHVYREPYGVTLLIGPWNYPFTVNLHPLINSLAGGNCAILKPSEFSTASSAVLGEIVREAFSPEYCTVVQGGVRETTELLENKFDFILFTGSTRVGRIVHQAAARHLTPTLLELGGKSPCILDTNLNLELTAKRICWGKFFNAGQTCTAPDYLLVPESMHEAILETLKKTIVGFFGENPKTSSDYGRIINARHFDKLSAFLDSGTIVHGGGHVREELFIEPTLLDKVSWDSPIMQEEIFGPLLPILTYKNTAEVISRLQGLERPLALYSFSRDKQWHRQFIASLPYGGGCCNAVLMHGSTPYLPFGGVGNSGMGHYHGKWGFEAFTHAKGVLYKPQRMDTPLLYPPYGDKLKWLKRLM